MEDKCLRCGRCCVVFNPTLDEWEDCPYLIHTDDGKTECSVYETRLDRDLGFNCKCTYRDNIPFDIPGCPYNRGYPRHPAYLEE